MSIMIRQPVYRAAWLVFLAASVGGAIAIPACGGGEKAPEAKAPPPAAPREVTFTGEEVQHAGVKWNAVNEVTMAPSVEVPGQVMPDENRTVRLSAPAQGRLLSVRVNVGDRVSRGQVLATMQSQEATSARADYAKAVAETNSRQTAATYARTSRERAERLFELKAASRQDVERARTDDEVAQSGLVQAKAEVDRARTALAHLGVDQNGEIVLRSTTGGVVLGREAVAGSVVGAGAPLVTITDASTLWLQVAATEALASALRPGAQVRFTVPAFPGEPFDARVQNVGGALDPQTRTVPVRAVISNVGGRLRPEMFATVLIETGAPRTAVAVPETSLQLLDEKPVVFVARPDGTGGAKFERRDVEVGAKRDGRAQIVRGLNAGDVVVTDGAFAVKSQFARSKMPSEG
jgi:cobalt-zinc-cadmium efflux system membrane fusion protein